MTLYYVVAHKLARATKLGDFTVDEIMPDWDPPSDDDEWIEPWFNEPDDWWSRLEDEEEE